MPHHSTLILHRFSLVVVAIVACFCWNSIMAATHNPTKEKKAMPGENHNLVNGTGVMNVALASNGAIALADAIFADTIFGENEEYHGAAFAIDGKWVGPGISARENRTVFGVHRPYPHWLWIHFRQPATISRVVLHRAELIGYPVDFMGEYSPDNGLTFKPLFEVKDNKMGPDDFSREYSFTPVITDNFRLRITRSSIPDAPQEEQIPRSYPECTSSVLDPSHPSKSNAPQLAEVEVFGHFLETKAKSIPETSAVSLPEPRLTPTTSEGLEIKDGRQEMEFRSRWLRLVIAKDKPRITAFSWDSLGKGDVGQNLLRGAERHGGAPAELYKRKIRDRNLPGGKEPYGWELVIPGLVTSYDTAALAQLVSLEQQENVIRYIMEFPDGVRARWEMQIEAKSVRMAIAWANPVATAMPKPPALRLVFDMDVSSVTPMARPVDGEPIPRLSLPCLIQGGKNGSLLISSNQADAARVTGKGVFEGLTWDLFVSGPLPERQDRLHVWPQGNMTWDFTFTVEKIPMAAPELVASEPRLWALPRHWLNVFQYRPDCGLLVNNIVSQPCAHCIALPSEVAAFTPHLPGNLQAMELVAISLDYWLSGIPGTGNNNSFMDGTPRLCQAAWDATVTSGDKIRLARWLPALEGLVAGWKSRDVDNNGLYESHLSGNRGCFSEPCNGWDQVNFGHEDAYSLALGYRGLRCLADLERLAGRATQAKIYDHDADRILAAYVPTFLNPKTGILSGWKSRDGELHDYWFTMINGMAISYGLVPDDLANQIMDRFMAKMREVGYTRFDLGMPWTLVPIPKYDYHAGMPIALGGSVKEDGSDGFQNFCNGGTQAFASPFIEALYKLGRRVEADKILWAELGTFAANGFQNGLYKGGEMTRWDGTPSGYEGYVAHVYRDPLAIYKGYWGIGLGVNGFYLEPWSPLKGKRIKLGVMYMGKIVDEIQ